MLNNFHCHTCLCDGKNTPEEMVITAIHKGFTALGFSGHAPTSFGEEFGMKNVQEYIKCINHLKEKYKNQIQIYLGIEEDALNPIENREAFDYIIGSNHFIKKGETVLPLDLSIEGFKECLRLFDNDVVAFADSYYSTFCDYILKYKPDIIGHFDLITKFDEQDNYRLLDNKKYNNLAEKYLKSLLKTDSIFEINLGAMARGYRISPYPAVNLLKILKRKKAKIIVSSDAHNAENLDFAFAETEGFLQKFGFKHIYTLEDNKFVKKAL